MDFPIRRRVTGIFEEDDETMEHGKIFQAVQFAVRIVVFAIFGYYSARAIEWMLR